MSNLESLKKYCLTGSTASSWFYKHAAYTWGSNRLVSEDATDCQNIGLPETSCPKGSLYTRTLSYDGDGNVEHVTLVWGGSTTTMDYGWEPGTHHLQSVTRNGSVIATFEYDRLNRLRKFCKNGNNCHLFSYVGDSDWLSVVRNQHNTIVQRYLYANGRPLRMDDPSHYQNLSYYYRYNARGDAAAIVQKNGDGGSTWGNYGAWGDTYDYGAGYYNWNAAWGYLAFPDVMFPVPGDALEGIYYAHGRWYVADTGLWLSPNEKGDYLYGGDGQDPVNIGWRTLASPPTNPCETNPQSQECNDYNLLNNGGYSEQFGVCLPFGLGCSGGPGNSTLPTQQVGPRLPNMLILGVGVGGNYKIGFAGLSEALVIDYKHHQIGTYVSVTGGASLHKFRGWGAGPQFGFAYCNEECKDIRNFEEWFSGGGGSAISPYPFGAIGIGAGFQYDESLGHPEVIQSYTVSVLLGQPGAEYHANGSYAKNAGQLVRDMPQWLGYARSVNNKPNFLDIVDAGENDMAMRFAVYAKVLQFTGDMGLAGTYADYTFLSPYGQ